MSNIRITSSNILLDKFIRLAREKKRISIEHIDTNLTEVISTDFFTLDEVISWMYAHRSYTVTDFTYGARNEIILQVIPNNEV